MRLNLNLQDFPVYLAKGNVKTCYVGSRWPDRVLKVSPVDDARLTRLEIDYFERLERKGIRADFLPKYYGWYQDDQWIGYVQELIQGESIMTLTEYMRMNILQPARMKHLEELLQKLHKDILESKVLILNLHTENILVDASTMQFWVVDGFGTPEKIPLPYWFDFCRVRKFKKHWAKFERRYFNTKTELETAARRDGAS